MAPLIILVERNLGSSWVKNDNDRFTFLSSQLILHNLSLSDLKSFLRVCNSVTNLKIRESWLRNTFSNNEGRRKFCTNIALKNAFSYWRGKKDDTQKQIFQISNNRYFFTVQTPPGTALLWVR